MEGRCYWFQTRTQLFVVYVLTELKPRIATSARNITMSVNATYSAMLLCGN